MSELDTISVRVHLSKTEELKFLIGTGAEISMVKGVSLIPRFDYEPTKGINVRRIANTLIKTEGTLMLKLFTPTHETTHTFHVMGNSFDCKYNGILGHDFWENKRTTINYCGHKIVMGKIMINFEDDQ